MYFKLLEAKPDKRLGKHTDKTQHIFLIRSCNKWSDKKFSLTYEHSPIKLCHLVSPVWLQGNFLENLFTKNIRLRTKSASLLWPKERDRSSHLYYCAHSSLPGTSFLFKYYLLCFNIVCNFSMVIHASFQIPTDTMWEVVSFHLNKKFRLLAEHRQYFAGLIWQSRGNRVTQNKNLHMHVIIDKSTEIKWT